MTISDESLIVEKISLLYTIFTDLKSMQVTQVPNIVLNNLWIDNLSRSKAMKEVVEVNISYDTSFEDIELLRLEMEKFVRHPDNSRDFQQDLVIGVGGVGDCDKLTLKIVIKHKSNWHNESVRATRRSKFMCALALGLKKVPIFGPGGGATPAVGSFENPQYAVTVDDTYAAQARDKATREADAARMVPHLRPKGPGRTDTSGHPVKHVSEAQAVEELTARPPLAGMDSSYGYNRDGEEDELNRRPQQQQQLSPSPSPSRDAEQAQHRAEGIEQIRSDLMKRNSTVGRRRAGEGVPSTPLGDTQPGFSVTQYDSAGNPIQGSNRQFSYDVADPLYAGGSTRYGGSGYGQVPSQPQVSPRVVEAAQESFSLYQGSAAAPAGSAAGAGYVFPYAMAEGEQPAQAAQSGGGLAPTARHGARPRGASVSRVEEEAEQARGKGERGAKKQFTK